MYFKKIEIKNYGCISEFKYQFNFDDQGNPTPCIFIGENGKGKTLLLSNLVDLLVESKRMVYGTNIFETAENKYFKIGSKNYIKNGNTYSKVLVEGEYDTKQCSLLDIMSTQPNVDIINWQQSDIDNVASFKEDGFSKKISSTLKRKDFQEFISLYFPVDRYYYPMWFNKANIALNHPDIGSIDTPKYNLIKSDLFTEVREWLTEIYLEKITQQVSLPSSDKVPKEFRGRSINVLMETPMQRIISNVLSVIKGVPVESPQNFSRKNKMLSFTNSISACNDVSQFSDGEMNLFCLALNIIMAWDKINSGTWSLSDIKGCVIVDEVDSGLHIDYAYRALPKLLKLFPKVQFILTSHSPFFLSGMQNEYGDRLDILTMPEGIRISDISAFDEVKKAQDLFNESVATLREQNEALKTKIKSINSNESKIILFTEGETDVVLLKKAIEELSITDFEIEICAASTIQNKHSDSVLRALLENLQANNVIGNNIVIGMFDRDAKDAIKFKGLDGNIHKINDESYVNIGRSLYAFSLPIPHNRPEGNQISIEHYFTDDEIKTFSSDNKRLFMGNEFYSNGNHMYEDYNYKNIGNLYGTIKIIEHQTDKVVTDKIGNGDFSLSKSRFAKNVSEEAEGFENFNFSEFDKIFNIIRHIIEDEGKSLEINH